MMKTRQKTYEVDRTSVIYVENETELPCVIRQSVVYDKNQIGQWHNQLISMVYFEIETELSRPIWPSAACDKN